MKVVIVNNRKRRVNTVLVVFAILLLFSTYYSGAQIRGDFYYTLFPVSFLIVFFTNKYYPVLAFIKHNILLVLLFISVCFTTTLVFVQGSGYVQRMSQLSFFIISILLGYYCFYLGQFRYIDICFRLINVLVFVGSIFAIIEYCFEVYLDRSFLYSNYRNTGRLVSVFSHPITFAGILLYGIFYVILYKKSDLAKAAYLLIYFFCLYRTLSRSSWIACAITLCLFFFPARKVNLRTLTFGGFLVIGLIIFFSSDIGNNVFGVIYDRIQETENSVSMNQRVGTIVYFCDQTFKRSNLLEILFGHGERASKDVMLSIKIITADFGTTDNSYIQLLYNYGLVMLLGFLYCMIKIVRNILILGRKQARLEWLLFPQCISAFFFEITENHTIGFVFLFLFGAWLCKESQEKFINESTV